jgi:hypothetical protein
VAGWDLGSGGRHLRIGTAARESECRYLAEMPRNPRDDPPEWWDWDLAFTHHVESRMEERGFSEVELRTMLAETTELVPARQLGRFLAQASHGGRPWTVVLEPDPDDQVLFVVTAFPLDEP